MKYKPTPRPKRNDLILINATVIDNGSDLHGDIIITVTNGTAHAVSAPIVLESNLPMFFEDERGILNDLGRASTNAMGKEITVESGKSVESVFHWHDRDDSLKFLRVQARFMASRTDWFSI